MTAKVSQSHTAQNEPKPTRDERDAAYSSGGGREAEEEELLIAPRREELVEPPIGTDLETRADEIDFA